MGSSKPESKLELKNYGKKLKESEEVRGKLAAMEQEASDKILVVEARLPNPNGEERAQNERALMEQFKKDPAYIEPKALDGDNMAHENKSAAYASHVVRESRETGAQIMVLVRGREVFTTDPDSLE